MDESELLFNLFYVLLCMLIIYPPEEIQRLGLTIEQVFSSLLGDESINFVRYHQRRTCLNLFVHSCLPAMYFLIHELKFAAENEEAIVDIKSLLWKMALRFSLMALLAVPLIIINWRQQNWCRHPISKILVHYSNTPNNYEPVATDISNEYRRANIYKKKLNSISSVIATENWLIKTSLYTCYFAHQSNTSLSVAKTETYNISQDATDTLQMVSIKVQPNRAKVIDFHIRINAQEFRNLEMRLRRPIDIPENIHFHRNVVDRFIDVFKEQVALNPKIKADNINEKCFACMVAEPNIKIHKQCADVDETGQPLRTDLCCANCYCRPMWCIECLARWFSARQNDVEREFWLQQKCTCPMCRARFCILDVSYIEPLAENN